MEIFYAHEIAPHAFPISPSISPFGQFSVLTYIIACAFCACEYKCNVMFSVIIYSSRDIILEFQIQLADGKKNVE